MTKEKIEKLAEQIANKHSKHNGEIIGNPRAIMLGTEAIQAVKEGYTQCQEDNELQIKIMANTIDTLEKTIEVLNSQKKYTIEDMRNFGKKCCLLWNEENEISYPEMVDLEIRQLQSKK